MARPALRLGAVLMVVAPAAAWSAVAYQSASDTFANSVTGIGLGINLGSGPERALVVGLSFGPTAPAMLIVTCGGQPMVPVPGTTADNGNAHTRMWYLASPPNGSANIAASWSGSTNVVMGAVVFSGADLLTPIRDGTFATGSSSMPSITIPCGAGDMTFDTATLATSFSSSNQTVRWLQNAASVISGAASTGAGSTSVTHTWTGLSNVWVSSGLRVAAATADAGAPDAGSADSGVADAGSADAGVLDAGVLDAGSADSGVADAGSADAGDVDGATPQARVLHVGCGCRTEGSSLLLVLCALVGVPALRRRAGSRRAGRRLRHHRREHGGRVDRAHHRRVEANAAQATAAAAAAGAGQTHRGGDFTCR